MCEDHGEDCVKESCGNSEDSPYVVLPETQELVKVRMNTQSSMPPLLQASHQVHRRLHLSISRQIFALIIEDNSCDTRQALGYAARSQGILVYAQHLQHSTKLPLWL